MSDWYPLVVAVIAQDWLILGTIDSEKGGAYGPRAGKAHLSMQLEFSRFGLQMGKGRGGVSLGLILALYPYQELLWKHAVFAPWWWCPNIT